jgi:hypothetical protein
MKKFAILLACAFVLTACQAATPTPPLNAELNNEFTLAPGQSVVIADTGLSITLVKVDSDERCPRQVECAASGPVALTLSVQMNGAAPGEVKLRSFTNDNGLVPNMEFDGIQNRATYAGYLIRMAGVLPYPAKSKSEIEGADYRVSLVITR